MARRRTGGRVFWRKQGRRGRARACGDFPDYVDVGGRQEALIPEGGSIATDDPVIAEAFVARRLVDLQERRRSRVILGIERQTTLGVCG